MESEPVQETRPPASRMRKVCWTISGVLAVLLVTAIGLNWWARGTPGYWTPLHHAAKDGDMFRVELLLLVGANVNAGAGGDVQPIHVAAMGGHSRVVRRLLRAGAKANARDTLGYTPLTRAAGAGDAESVRLLLAAGAKPNTAGQYNRRTPLHGAAVGGNPACVRLLLDAGANPAALEEGGITPLMLAMALDQTACVDLLKSVSPSPDLERVRRLRGLFGKR